MAGGRLHKLMSNNYDLIIIPAMDWVKEVIGQNRGIHKLAMRLQNGLLQICPSIGISLRVDSAFT